MIKLGLVFLGIGVVSIPIGYKIYKDFGNTFDLNESSSESSEQKDVENLISTPLDQQKQLSKEQEKILNGSKQNGNCKINVFVDENTKYKEISKLEEKFDLSGLFDELSGQNNLRGKGACKQSNPSYGRESKIEGVEEGMMMKKQDSGKGDIEEDDLNEL